MISHFLQGSLDGASDSEAGAVSSDAAQGDANLGSGARSRLRRRQSRTPAESPSSKRGFEIEAPDDDAALSNE